LKGRHMTRTWDFTLVLTGVSDLTDDLADALFEAGCDDATPSVVNGKPLLDFSREAESLEKAVLAALEDIRRAGKRLGIPLDVERME
jgi:hypothetical protein